MLSSFTKFINFVIMIFVGTYFVSILTYIFIDNIPYREYFLFVLFANITGYSFAKSVRGFKKVVKASNKPSIY